MLYYQALENYMRALLRLAGKEPERIRAYMHDFATMLEHCQAAGLVVRAKTAAFIKETRLDSDYVRVRYELQLEIPRERASQGTPGKELSRLVSATLEMHKKTRNALIKSGIANP
jgi:HEPN domain-containing protein